MKLIFRQALIFILMSIIPALELVGCGSGESDNDEDETADQDNGVKPDLGGVGVGVERPPAGSTTGVTTGTATGSSGTATGSTTATGTATGTGTTSGPGSTTGTPIPEPSLCDFTCLRLFDCDADDVTNLCDVDPCDADIVELKPSCIPPDSDGDGEPDATDNCERVPNPDQADIDNDGAGDLCDATDCADRDNDTRCDDEDNCPDTLNFSQADMDSDGIGNPCDPDRDGDGDPNDADNCPDIANADQANTDDDAFGDVCEDDIDNDGILNAADSCDDRGPVEADRVADTVVTSWNGCLYDSDGDGIADPLERSGCVLIDDMPGDVPCSTTDTDRDGLPNDIDLCPTNSEVWSLLKATKTLSEEPSSACGASQSMVSMMINGIADPICSTASLDEDDVLNDVTRVLSLGRPLPTEFAYTAVPNWSDITISRASNSSMVTTCTDQATSTSRTLCGVFQNDADGDGVGDGCDSAPLINPGRLPNPDMTIDPCGLRPGGCAMVFELAEVEESEEEESDAARDAWEAVKEAADAVLGWF